MTALSLLPASGGLSSTRSLLRVERALAGAALLMVVLEFHLAGLVALSNDEAYYRLWSLHPALSYFDHPPMVAWLIAAGQSLAGDTPLGIRFLAPTLYLVSGVGLYRTANILYGRPTATISAWIAIAMPLMSVGGMSATPDLPSVLFYVLGVWALAELEHSQNANWWYAVGVIAGLGLLSKYTNLFLGAAILIWVVAVPANRKWLRSPQLWIAGLLALVLTAPVLIWNAQHGWSSFAFQFGRVVTEHAKMRHTTFEMIATFAGLASPVIAGLALMGIVEVTRRAIRTRNAADVLLAAAVLPMTLYFAVHSLHSQVNGNWMSPIYPLLAICAARALSGRFSERTCSKLCMAAVGCGLLFTAGVFVQALHPIHSLPADPLEQLRGWPALADEIDSVRKAHGAGWVATSALGTNAQLTFALKSRADVYQLNDRHRYVDFPPLAAGLRVGPALYVERAVEAKEDLLHTLFANVSYLGLLSRSGRPGGTAYKLFLVSSPLKALP